MERFTMRPWGTATMWLSLALLPAFAAGANSAALTPAQTEQARQWVKQLAHKSFKTREQASRKLEELGRSAIPVLEDAVARASDMEGKRRCEQLLELARRTDTELALARFLSKQ